MFSWESAYECYQREATGTGGPAWNSTAVLICALFILIVNFEISRLMVTTELLWNLNIPLLGSRELFCFSFYKNLEKCGIQGKTCLLAFTVYSELCIL